MSAYRVIAIVLVGAMVLVAAVPIVVLVDLVGGGDGWGLCPGGLDACNMSYFDGFELVALITLVLFAFVFLLRIVQRLDRRRERKRAARVNAPASPPRPPAARRPGG